jgi:basic membrane protein A
MIQAMIDGTWRPADIIWEGIDSNADSSPLHLSYDDNNRYNPIIPESLQLSLNAQIAQISRGELDPFGPPVHDNKGILKSSVENPLTDEDLLAMCWYVEGVFSYNGSELIPAKVPERCDGQR